MKYSVKYLKNVSKPHIFKHENISLRVCELALKAYELGSAGVGAMILDHKGTILVEGYNEVYIDGFRSDLHAEMVVMNEFELKFQERHDMGMYTLITSLEPCPMCMTRLIFAGVGTILFVSPDVGGMVQRMTSLPPIFQDITKRMSQTWELVECSEEIRLAAFYIWKESKKNFISRTRT